MYLLYKNLLESSNILLYYTDRKSRFNSQQSPPPPQHLTAFNAVPLSRNNSNVSNTGPVLTRENSSQTRGNRPEDPSSESRKIGRFELTSNHTDLRQSVVDSSKFYEVIKWKIQ